MTTQDTLTQVQQAILQERTRRGYAVVVTDPHKAIAVAGVPIPEDLEAYDAETSCTEKHAHAMLELQTFVRILTL